MIRMFSYFWSKLYMPKYNFNFNYIILINIKGFNLFINIIIFII